MFIGIYPSACLTASPVQGESGISLEGSLEGRASPQVDEYFSHFQVSVVPLIEERSMSLVHSIARVSLHSHCITGQRTKKSHSEHS